MSLFLLSNNFSKTNEASAIWSELYESCQTINLSEDVKIVTSNNFNRKNIFIRETNLSKIVGIGTWFSEDGFFEESITPQELEDFTQETSEKLFGHYCFIIFDKNSSNTRILTDPGGLINVYASTEDNDIYISNDPKMIAELRAEVNLSKTGIHEFVTGENTIGSGTVFNEIKRLKLGCEFLLSNNCISENKLYFYNPKKLTKEEYIAKVETYFKAISNYKGKIATELSAGYDTRVVAACASKTIPDLLAITNDNKSDRGVDVETSKLIVDKLNLRLEKIIRPDDLSLESDVMLHSFGIGRNIIRSKAMPYINKTKYQHADLILGGYGGEVLRAKYCKFSELEDFVKNYYGGKYLLEWGFTDTYENIIKKLDEEYSQDWITNSDQLSNWLYLMDRMRIWGGSAALGKLIYGDRIHPFMDWQLAGPILQTNVNELKDAKLLRNIIKKFSPEILNIPINAIHPIFLDNLNQVKHNIYSILWQSLNYKNRVYNYFGLFKKSEKKTIFNSSLNNNSLEAINLLSGVDNKRLLSMKNPDMISRYISLEILYKLVK